MDSPDCLLLLLSISVFYVLVFSFTLLVGFRAHVKIASRVVEYHYQQAVCMTSTLPRIKVEGQLSWF